MISLRKISKTYPPQQRALDHVSFELEEGEIACIAGASGAGKSTLLKMLYGALPPTDGEALVVGRNLSSIGNGGLPHFRREVGYVFQDYKLLQERTVIENVAFPLEVQGISPSQRREIASEMLEMVDLLEIADRLPKSLSGGEQQRVALLRALIHRPKLLLADEPTGNLDPKMTRIVFNLLLEANRAGITVLIATHDLSMVEQLGLRTIVLDKGKVIGDFTPSIKAV